SRQDKPRSYLPGTHNPVSRPLSIISHEPVHNQRGKGIHVGISFMEFVVIKLLGVAMLRYCIADSIEQYFAANGITRFTLTNELNLLAIYHPLIGPRPPDPIVLFEPKKFLPAHGLPSANFLQEAGSRS